MAQRRKRQDERIWFEQEAIEKNEGELRMALWGGRFATNLADSVFSLSRSVHFDWRLAPYDIVSSKAHLAGLRRNGILAPEVATRIDETLDSILEEVLSGKLLPLESDEDVHSALERILIERIGESGGALRAGRSRNDQVVTDVKLYLLDVTNDVMRELLDLASAFLSRADEHLDVIAPGFTHLQHAQPVSFGQELAKHAYALERDVERLVDWRKRTLLSPLGSGALAGSALVPDPEHAAQVLGFEGTVGNSIDGVSDRDFVAEILFIFSLVGTHLSRIGEEFTLWSMSEFAWVRVDDAYSTGSSIMPQKRNPDVAELARGKAGRLLGNLVSVMTVLKGLPFAYNRDLQEDKEPIFDSIDTLLVTLPALRGMVESAKFDRDRITKGAVDGFALATEVADYLVRRGIPFAQAHEITGAAVRRAESLGLTLEAMGIDEFRSVNSSFDKDLVEVLSAHSAVGSRRSAMGTSPDSVARSNLKLKAKLKEHEEFMHQEVERLNGVLGR
jgi:argininosuccinate lyase